MRYEAILSDMDGTLLETGPLWNRATRIATARHEIELTEPEYLSLAGWKIFHELLAEKGIAPERITQIRSTRDEALLPIIRDEAQWREGAREWLETVDVPKGIITNTHQYVYSVLDETLGISRVVETTVVGDDVRPNLKPHPDGLLLACKRLNVDPAHCVYLGDQAVDLAAAANAGMDAILIRGIHTPNDVAHHTMVEDFEQLRTLLA